VLRLAAAAVAAVLLGPVSGHAAAAEPGAGAIEATQGLQPGLAQSEPEMTQSILCILLAAALTPAASAAPGKALAALERALKVMGGESALGQVRTTGVYRDLVLLVDQTAPRSDSGATGLARNWR
jgi:hypothetical protein